MNDPEEKEPKIIVDSDWKEQVQKEREQEAKADTPVTGASDEPKTQTQGAVPPRDDQFEPPTDPPEASFVVLVSMLFSQAMSLLGQVPGPDGKTEVNKPFAKHTIDTLEMLGEKTAGNLDDEEKQVLSEALHVLRMAFVNTKSP